MLSEGDANSSGTVDAADLAIWESQFGTTVPPLSALTVAIPEPTTLLLGALASVGLLMRRRKRL